MESQSIKMEEEAYMTKSFVSVKEELCDDNTEYAGDFMTHCNEEIILKTEEVDLGCECIEHSENSRPHEDIDQECFKDCVQNPGIPASHTIEEQTVPTSHLVINQRRLHKPNQRNRQNNTSPVQSTSALSSVRIISSMKRNKVNQVIRKISGLLVAEIADILHEELTRKRKVWVKTKTIETNTTAGAGLLLNELSTEDLSEHRVNLRMSPECFEMLHNLIADDIQKLDTCMRSAIPSRTKLEIALSYLSTGTTYKNIEVLFQVSKPSISKIIPEVCNAIFKKLEDLIKVPGAEDWKKIEKGFSEKWNIPRCYGAIAGKHLLIHAQNRRTTSHFKRITSIDLLAIVDHEHCFKYIDVATNIPNGSAFRNSSLFQALENNLIPDNGVIIADDSFPLEPYIMKPYSGTYLTHDEKVFNYRLSRAISVAENAFGVLVNRFRIFKNPITCHISTADKVVRTACALHNWLIYNSATSYLPKGTVDIEDTNTGEIIPGNWRSETTKLPTNVCYSGTNHHSKEALATRDDYKSFVINGGQVSGQDKMVQ